MTDPTLTPAEIRGVPAPENPKEAAITEILHAMGNALVVVLRNATVYGQRVQILNKWHEDLDQKAKDLEAKQKESDEREALLNDIGNLSNYRKETHGQRVQLHSDQEAFQLEKDKFAAFRIQENARLEGARLRNEAEDRRTKALVFNLEDREKALDDLKKKIESEVAKRVEAVLGNMKKE